MEAEIFFLDPAALDPAVAELTKRGFAVTMFSPVYILARITTDLDEDRFFHWVSNIVKPLHGNVVPPLKGPFVVLPKNFDPDNGMVVGPFADKAAAEAWRKEQSEQHPGEHELVVECLYRPEIAMS
jgi:hypothetical protein